MSTHRISAQCPLSPDDVRAIDEYCGGRPLASVARFLYERFGLTLALDPEIVAGYAVDSSNLPGEATGLVRPSDEAAAAAAMRALFRAGVPVTLSGGRSNLTGSATPPKGVVLSTVALTDPAPIVDVEARTVTCMAGQPLEEMRRLILDATDGKLWFQVDPTSREEAEVGGAVSCNASGFTPGEAGAFRAWVRALRLLLPDGRLIVAERGQYVSQDGAFVLESPDGETVWPVPRYKRPAIKNASGPWSAPDGEMDFVDLVVGSEGLFGLVTQVTLDLAETAPDHLDLFFSLPTEADAVRFLASTLGRLHCNLTNLRAFEYFGVHCRKYMDHEERFFRGNDEVAVYVREPLIDREPEDAAEAWLETLAEAECDIDDDSLLLIDTPQLQTLFMEARHSMPANALEVVQERGTYTIMTDAVVPPQRFADFLAFCHERLKDDGLDYLSFGHLGDCHLHFTILPEADQAEKGVAAYDAIIAKSAELGGVYSGEHGTGKRKRKDFLRCYGPEAVEDVRRCKAAVDPDFLLNRGNVIECPPEEAKA